MAAEMPSGTSEAMVVAVSHDEFREIGAAGLRQRLVEKGVIYDLKQVLPSADSDARL